jgi:hypothetical protein
MQRLVVLGVVSLLGSASCHKKEEPSKRTGPSRIVECFDTHDRTSPEARAVFDRRHLQGGGPTWGAVLNVSVARHAQVVGPWKDAERPMGDRGPAFEVHYVTATTWFTLETVADGARFCGGHPGLVREVRRDFEQLNADPRLLEAALDQVKHIE